MSISDFLFSTTYENWRRVVKILGLKIPLPAKNIYKNTKINPKKIVFFNRNGDGYGCNPKYIAEEILAQKLPYDLVWVAKSAGSALNMKNFPKNIRVVEWGSLNALYEMSTAKVLVSNARLKVMQKGGWQKKKGQKYIQTWHGSFGIKRIEADSKRSFFGRLSKGSRIDSEYTDYPLSNCTFETDIFEKAFGYKVPMLEYGHPRNDVFFASNAKQKAMRNKVCKALKISLSKKIMLYAPAHRDDKSMAGYGLDIKNLLSALKSRFGGDWVVAVRFHPRVRNQAVKIFKFSNQIIDATYYDDMQELMLAADSMISDYSSGIFDFMLSQKPAFIFATDSEKYNNMRGFYYPLEATPFPVAKNNKELAKNIKSFDEAKYKKNMLAFLKGKGSIEDGKASSRVVKLIKKLTKEKK